MTNKEFGVLQNTRYHHTSWARGYISRKTNGYIIPYKGKFGIGYAWHRPSWHSTTYHLVSYYII